MDVSDIIITMFCWQRMTNPVTGTALSSFVQSECFQPFYFSKLIERTKLVKELCKTSEVNLAEMFDVSKNMQYICLIKQ